MIEPRSEEWFAARLGNVTVIGRLLGRDVYFPIGAIRALAFERE